MLVTLRQEYMLQQAEYTVTSSLVRYKDKSPCGSPSGS